MKFKGNIIKLLALSLLATPVVFTSCSEDAMDEVNKNPNNPTDVPAKFILADVITSTAFRNVGGDFNTYFSSYVEHEVGTHNQLWNAEQRLNEPSSSSTFNNSWNSIYETMRNARIVVDKCSVGGAQEGNNTTLGIAQVMLAYNIALATDMFGDMPYSEAFDPFGNKTPKLDKQEDLYKEVFRLLNAAIENLPKGDTHATGAVGSHDLLFGGVSQRWVQFAYGLKARYEMRLLNVAADKAAALNNVISNVEKSFASRNEEAAFNVYNAQNLNPLFDFQWSRDGLAASKSLADKYIDRNDPRLSRNFAWPQVFRGYVSEQAVGITPGSETYKLLAVNGENEQVQYHYLTSAFVYAQTASTQLLSYHELLFLKAEAMQRLGLAGVEGVLEGAIKEAFVNSEKSVEAAFTAPTVLNYGGVKEKSQDVSVSDVEAYFNNEVKALFQAYPLKEIAIQKYLAFSGASGESTEMYNDIRRWKALGEDLVELKNTKRFPLRAPYGNSETTTNPNVQAAFGNGQYVYSENVWWAGGTR